MAKKKSKILKNQFFLSVFWIKDKKTPCFLQQKKYEIIDLINKININKAIDIFGFSANVIKILLHEIAPVLCYIFSEIF